MSQTDLPSLSIKKYNNIFSSASLVFSIVKMLEFAATTVSLRKLVLYIKNKRYCRF